MCALYVRVFLRERLTQCFEIRGFIAAAFDLLPLSLSLGNIKALKWYFFLAILSLPCLLEVLNKALIKTCIPYFMLQSSVGYRF